MRSLEENVAEDSNPKKIIEPQLNIILTTYEVNERPVYFSENFNNWKTQDKKIEMDHVGEGLYHYKFTQKFTYPEELLYKFTRGDWSEVAIDKFCHYTIEVNS